MDTRTITQPAQMNGSGDAVRAAERRILVDRLAHAKVRYAKVEFDATTYQPAPNAVPIRAQLDRFGLELELDLADETIRSLEERISDHDEETRALGR